MPRYIGSLKNQARQCLVIDIQSRTNPDNERTHSWHNVRDTGAVGTHHDANICFRALYAADVDLGVSLSYSPSILFLTVPFPVFRQRPLGGRPSPLLMPLEPPMLFPPLVASGRSLTIHQSLASAEQLTGSRMRAWPVLLMIEQFAPGRSDSQGASRELKSQEGSRQKSSFEAFSTHVSVVPTRPEATEFGWLSGCKVGVLN
jgi:hypothetical protein